MGDDGCFFNFPLNRGSKGYERRVKTGEESEDEKGLNKDRPKRAEHAGVFPQSQTLEAETVGELRVAGQFRQQIGCIQK